MIERNQLAEEIKLRKFIRKAIHIVHERKKKRQLVELTEEKELRSFIRSLIAETKIPDTEQAPHSSTGINVLEDLLKKIIKIIELDFKKLTTNAVQRNSYRAHILQAVKNILAPIKIIDRAGESLTEVDEPDINIVIDDKEEDPEEFIDVRGEKEKKEPKDVEREEFTIGGEDETGRDMAYDTFKRIESAIVSAWDVLYSDEDKELFYDYLLTNLKLYFDKFEDELKVTLPEPTTPEYEAEKAKITA